MGTKVYDNALDLITFSRASNGTSLRKISYGSELVTNGTFDTDVSGWDETSVNATLTFDSGEANVVTTTSGVGIRQQLSLTVGKVYQASVTLTSNSGTCGLRIANAAFNSFTATAGDVSSGTETISVVWVAQEVDEYVYLRAGNAADFNADNVSVKEVLFDQPDGTLTLFNHPDDIPRIDYNADGTVRGLLVEEQRTNLLTYSEDFTDVSWVGLNAAIPTADAVGPDGVTNSAYTLVDDNSGGTGGVFFYTDISGYATATAHTWSVFVKEAGLSFAFVEFNNGTTPANGGVYFNLSSGTVGAAGSGYTGTIEDFGNGWYRCSIIFTTDAVDTSGRFLVRPATANGNTTVDLDGTSSILIYGAQLEAGAFPTSYIPTSGASATREPDIASIPVTDFGYNQKAGTVVVTGCKIDRVSTIAGTEIAMLSKVAFSTDNATRVFYRASGATGFFNTVSASTNVDLSPTGVLSAGQDLNIAFTYSEDDFATVANGGTVLTDTSGVVAEHTVLRIGAGQQHLNGHIKSIQYYPRRLTNAQLQELTA